jgi:predicted RNA-binding protein with RPS1 domain
VHVSELSYNRVNHPSEVLQVGQEVDVYVLSVDRERKKIALSLKKAQPDPWTTVDERYRVGQVVPAVITKLAKFGAFAQVEPGLEGLIHLSELTDMPVQDAAQVVQEGQHVNVKIIHINSQRRRLGLSVRQAVTPGSYMESYGHVDDNTPFAVQGLGAYGDALTTAYAPADYSPAPTSPQSVDSLVRESESPAGEQDSPAAESEPTAHATDVNGSLAAAPEEVSPTSPETSPTDDEADQPWVASAAPQGSVSE